MAKYHISKDGDPKPCRATKKPCPIGGEHFDSEEAARDHYEKTMENEVSSEKPKWTFEIPPYDAPEMSIMNRMQTALVEKHGWDDEDFDGMSFLDVEDAFLDAGEIDFRPSQIEIDEMFSLKLNNKADVTFVAEVDKETADRLSELVEISYGRRTSETVDKYEAYGELNSYAKKFREEFESNDPYVTQELRDHCIKFDRSLYEYSGKALAQLMRGSEDNMKVYVDNDRANENGKYHVEYEVLPFTD